MKNLKALKEFAAAVGLKIRTKTFQDQTADVMLCSANGEILCFEYDAEGMEQSICVYAGGNPTFNQAHDDYLLSVGAVR